MSDYINVDNKKKGTELLRQCDALFNSPERSNCENNWATLTEYLVPNQFGNFNLGTSQGGKTTNRLFDSTAPAAVNDLSATLHTLTTNEAIEWLKLMFSRDELNDDIEATNWLNTVQYIILSELSSSNFYTEQNKNLKSFVSLGNMALLVEEAMGDGLGFAGLQFKALHMSQVAWADGLDGKINVFFWKFKLSARNAYARWGDKCGKEIVKDFAKNPETLHSFVLVIQPNDPDNIEYNAMGLADPEARPFKKCIIERNHGTVVEEGGYYEFPVMGVRWETLPEEMYGRGPGHIALPDVRSLNRLRQLKLEAMALAVRPPLVTTSRAIIGSLNFKPGGLTVLRNINDLVPLNTGVDFNSVDNSIEELRQSVKGVFFIDKIIFPPRNQTGEMTATEVVERINQMQKVLGPTLGRLNTELLNPLIQRIFGIMMRKGAFPPVPQSMANGVADIDIKYVNPLARSQQIEEVQSIHAWIQDLALMAQVGQAEGLDNIDADGVSKTSAKIRGVPPIAIKSSEDVQAMRQQRAQMQQEQMQLENNVKSADAAAKSAKAQPAPTSPTNLKPSEVGF